MRTALLLSAITLTTVGAGCNERAPAPSGEPTAPSSRVALSIGALTLPGVTDVRYRVTVATPGTPPATVWTKELRSSAFGTGRGDVSYVGPCDAAAGANTISLHIEEITGPGELALDDWVDPGVLVQTVDCKPNADAPVRFDITIGRRANQGFFDVAVNFDDIFCSAKLDCSSALLFHGGARAETVVLAFACTTGAGTPTVLHVDTVELDCTDGVRYLDPTLGPGNTGQTTPHVYEVATYRGREQLAPYEKCYWNTAIGVDVASFAGADPPVSCTLHARAAASTGPWESGLTPAGAVYPYIEWSVPLVVDNVLACGAHPLDVAGSGVRTVYATPAARQRFQSSLTCATCTDGGCDPTLNGRLCAGTLPGVAGPVTFTDTDNGVVVTVDHATTAPLPLPEGYTLAGCCANPCCSE